MSYIQQTPNPSGAYSTPQSDSAPGLLEFPDELIPIFLEHSGFVTLTIEDGIVTAITGNDEAYQAWLASLPPPEPPEPTEMELAQQAITDQELNNIETNQRITDLELMILGGEAIV